MHEIFTHPALQAGLLPFIAALLSAELFQRLRLSGLAVIAGFAATVYFASDFNIDPLTETHKIIWLGIGASILALPLTLLPWAHWRTLLSLSAAIATAWAFWDSLQQRALVDALAWGTGCALYAAWLVFWFDELREKSVAAANAGLALGLGSGCAALLASAYLPGRFALALGAAAAGYLLIQAISNTRLACGRSFTLPLALIAALAGCSAVLAGQQPWYTLPVLALIPLAVRIPVPERWTIWLQSLALSLLSCACAGAAIYLTWNKGAPLF